MYLKMLITFLERVNIAANAVIAEQAAAARLLLASQALAQCREENNPFLPSNPFGPSLSQRWGPDPCLEQEKELAGATTAHQEAAAAAQISNAPASQNLAAAPGTQLSNTWEPSELFEGTLQNTDYPQLQSMWSPTSVEDVLEMIAVQMEADQVGEMMWEEMGEELDRLRRNMTALLCWDISHQTVRRRLRLRLTLTNTTWIGSWSP